MREDWISLGEAARLVKSPRPGRRTATSTIYRWVLSGKLPAMRRGRWYFVRRSDVEALMEPVEVGRYHAPTSRERERLQKETREILDRFGL